MRVRRHAATVALLSFAALSTGACGRATEGPTAADDGGVEVVATTSILGDVVAQLVGDAGTVTILMGPGVDPHAFEISPQQAQRLREADVVVANGLALEANLRDALDAAEADGARVHEVGPELDPIAYQEPDGADEHSDQDHGHGTFDPHVWLDASRMADTAELLATELAMVDESGDDQRWSQRGADLAAAYRDLDAEIAETLSVIPADQRVLVTNHDALGYFAARYDFEVLGTVIPGASTQAESNPRHLGELAGRMRTAGVPAIFADAAGSTRLADTLADEVGDDIEVVTLFSGSLGPPGSGAATYPEMMRTNAQRIAQALTS